MAKSENSERSKVKMMEKIHKEAINLMNILKSLTQDLV